VGGWGDEAMSARSGLGAYIRACICTCIHACTCSCTCARTHFLSQKYKHSTCASCHLIILLSTCAPCYMISFMILSTCAPFYIISCYLLIQRKAARARDDITHDHYLCRPRSWALAQKGNPQLWKTVHTHTHTHAPSVHIHRHMHMHMQMQMHMQMHMHMHMHALGRTQPLARSDMTSTNEHVHVEERAHTPLHSWAHTRTLALTVAHRHKCN